MSSVLFLLDKFMVFICFRYIFICSIIVSYMKLSEGCLQEIANQSLEIAADGIRKDTCDVVSNEFGYTLENRHDISVKTVKAPVNGAKHFVSVIESNEVNNYENQGYIIVDITIRQFSDKFDEELPEVLILGPNDDWDFYYDEVKI